MPNIDDQLIVRIASKSIYVASLGINPAATNLTDHEHPVPTVLETLKQKQIISSLSWAYTAGSFFEYQSMNSVNLILPANAE